MFIFWNEPSLWQFTAARRTKQRSNVLFCELWVQFLRVRAAISTQMLPWMNWMLNPKRWTKNKHSAFHFAPIFKTFFYDFLLKNTTSRGQWALEHGAASVVSPGKLVWEEVTEQELFTRSFVGREGHVKGSMHLAKLRHLLDKSPHFRVAF